MLVGNSDKHVDKLYVHFERGRGISIASLLGGTSILLSPQGRTWHQQHHGKQGALHVGMAGHLDASGPAEVPWRGRISAGKGSPSAHTAPSSKNSFFQMGTIFLRVSITHRQASNAGPRCA